MDYTDYVCGDCNYCRMWYDKQGWEIIACGNEDGRGTDDPDKEACKHFEMREE